MKNYEDIKGCRYRIVFDQDSKTFVSRKIEESGVLLQPEHVPEPPLHSVATPLLKKADY